MDPNHVELQNNFEKIRAHFDCLTELSQLHGDLNDVSKLRQVLRHSCFALGHARYGLRSLQQELKFAKSIKERLRKEKLEIQKTSQQHESELQQAKSKLYDIEFDCY